MVDEPLRVLAGDCTVVYEDGADRREHRGHVATLVKPDGTVLVHDATGYQPAAWLTRADAVSCSRGDEVTVSATSGDRRLRVASHARHGFARYPTSPAGVPVGRCPDCDGALVRADGAVACVDCDRHHGVPADATVLDRRCACGLPRMRVERGAAFEVCVDRACESLDAAVKAEFDAAWDCPACGGDLRILRRGGLLAGCADYPDCDTGFGVPAGVVVDECGCGLPVFETATGRRCLDASCVLREE